MGLTTLNREQATAMAAATDEDLAASAEALSRLTGRLITYSDALFQLENLRERCRKELGWD